MSSTPVPREDRSVAVTMRTPGHDFELAAGYVVHEGLAHPGSVRGVAYCTDRDLSPGQEYNVVTLTLDAPPLVDPTQRHAGFGAGGTTHDAADVPAGAQAIHLADA